MLRFDGELGGLDLGYVVPSLHPIEQIQAQISAEGLFDDLAIGLTGARSLHLDGPKDVLVDRQRGARLRHGHIMASTHQDACGTIC